MPLRGPWPGACVFDEDDIRAAGGIIGVETELQRDCYWFVRLGMMDVGRLPKRESKTKVAADMEITTQQMSTHRGVLAFNPTLGSREKSTIF
jgi:hypothetical protein